MTENVTTDVAVGELIQRLYIPGANDTVLQNVLDMYPENLDLVRNSNLSLWQKYLNNTNSGITI